MRRYESIWLQIKKVPVGVTVEVRTHVSSKRRLIQAVKLEKTKEVATKKKIGMLRPGPLVIRTAEDPRKDPDFIVVCFSLAWDGSKI